jgi:energy-coupling factor transport system ATP-binding protein
MDRPFFGVDHRSGDNQPAANKQMITIRELSYSYPSGAGKALCAVNWQVQAGEFVLLAGPSASGKSTLLRCLNGLVPHFSGGTISGQVEVDGLDAIAVGPRVLSRHVGFVSQSPEAQAVLDEVEAEIAFALENAAIPTQEMRVRVEEVLDLLDLAPLRGRSLASLSGGERQRVAIAAALALRPALLVLDEPTSQLDPQSADDVLRSLIRLNEDLGLTIVLADCWKWQGRSTGSRCRSRSKKGANSRRNMRC